MTTTVLSHKQVKTRKPHRCYGCWHLFPAGTMMTSQTVAEDGAIGTSYTCQHCQDWLDNNTDDWDWADWESLLPGSVGYWKDGIWKPSME